MVPLAIVGCALRTPGAANAEEFWALLMQQQSTIAPVPAWRWDVRQLLRYRSDIARGDALRWGSFLPGIKNFDADFFGIAPEVASTMDPQQRQVLELGYLCAEHAGLSLQALQGTRTGVYIGISSYDYNRLMGRDYRRINAHAAVGTSQFAAANRLSWFFKTLGPSMSVDAACASSFVALHQASQALHSGDIDLAFVGGVNAILTPDVAISFAQAGLLSQDGHCRVFDAKADGYVRAEACGMVAVKRLDDALREGDQILGVVRSVKLAQTGFRQGFMTPNGIAQETLMRDTWQAAGIAAQQLDYLEAHATGTALGDAIELTAMHKQLRAGQRTVPCAVGSYKPNIGYPEAASGLVGLIKVLKMFEHKQIPGQASFESLNPALESCTLLDIAANNRPWAGAGQSGAVQRGLAQPRLAGLNALGAGGTYAHVVLEAPPVPAQAVLHWPAADEPLLDFPLSDLPLTDLPLSGLPLWVLPLSAPNPMALQRVLAAMAQAQWPMNTLAQACWQAAHRRTHFKCRRLAWGHTAQDLLKHIQELANASSQHEQNNAFKPSKRAPKVLLQVQAASPQPALLSSVLDCLKGLGIVPAQVLEEPAAEPPVEPALGLVLIINGNEICDEHSVQRFVLQALAQFYEAGGDPQWPGQGEQTMPTNMVLPPYEFAAQRHWVDDVPIVENGVDPCVALGSGANNA